MGENYLTLLGIWNVIVFLLYGIDKWCAKNNKWRISEKTLVGPAFLMGAVGAILGMKAFRHKTRKRMFSAFVALAFLVNIGIIVWFERI